MSGATDPAQPLRERWLTRPVVGIGGASLLSDLGHEVPTALLPSLLTSTLGAPAAALGVIEGVADGVGGAARFAGGALADDPHRRRAVAIGGYASTAVLSGLIGAAGAVWEVGALRAGAWAARGVRGPARNALLADAVPVGAYGRAYGFERAMDNLGAVGGPLLAIGLVGALGVRGAILLSVIPGLMAALAMVYAIRHTARPTPQERRPLRIHVRPVLRGGLGRLMVGIGAFECGNIAATLLILRATELLAPGRSHAGAVQVALILYTLYNLTATLASIPGGRLTDRRGAVLVMVAGIALFGLALLGFAFSGESIALLAACFTAAGVANGLVETAEAAAVAGLAPTGLRGSAFGLLATVQSFGNLIASAIAGLLWTVVSPTAGLLFAAALMVVALLAMPRRTPAKPSDDS